MIPFISPALLSWRQLCVMCLAHDRSFKADLMLSAPSLQIWDSPLGSVFQSSGKDNIMESSLLDFSDSPALRRWWLDITV